MNFERGFKAWAERTALDVRRDLELFPHSPVSIDRLAAHFDIRLCTPAEVRGLDRKYVTQLLQADPSGWSAVSVYHGSFALIIYNPAHSTARRASDVAHEIAHFILGHKPATLIMSHDGSFAMRSYDQVQEEQANWLGWCLLLPRDALVYCRRSGLDADQIAEMYGVSLQLVRFRCGVTGVEAQMRATRNYRRRD